MGNPRIDAGMIGIVMGVVLIAVSHNTFWQMAFGLFFVGLGAFLMFTRGAE